MNGAGQARPNFPIVLLTIIIVVAALRLAQDVLIPVALAILLTFLLAPLVNRLQRHGVNRIVGTILTLAIALSVLGALATVVMNQFVELVGDLPQYRRQLRENIGELSTALRGEMNETSRAVEELTEEIKQAAPASEPAEPVPRVEVVEPPPTPLEELGGYVAPVAKPLGTAALVVVFVIFMLVRFADLRDRLIRLLGAGNLRVTTEALDDAARRVSRYLLMHTLINGIQGVLVAVGLTLIGVPNAVLFGALTLVLRFIPYIGPWVAAALPVALSFAVFDGWQEPLLTLALVVSLETMSNLVLEPWLYGSGTGVSPVALLVAAAFWTWLWGFAGLFLAIPLTVCLVVMGKYIPQLEFLHVLLGDQPVLAAHERLYQRLLARDTEDADDELEEALRDRRLLEVCDQVIVPTVHLTEDDHDRGSLDQERRRFILDHLGQWADEEALGPLLASAEGEAAEGGQPRLDLPGGTRVLCVPARDQADEVTARWLVRLLRYHQVEADWRPVAILRADLREAVAAARPGIIVVSALPPDAVTRARHLCKRLRARFPGVPIIVGLWCARGDLQRAAERLHSAGANRVVTSFASCLQQSRTLVGQERPAERLLETS